ncbi:MAG: SLC13 family permease [Candidatus Binatia bacterium]
MIDEKVSEATEIAVTRSWPRRVGYLLGLGAVIALAVLGGLDGRQTLSVAVFAAFILGTLLYWRFRLAFALVGVAVLLAADLVNLKTLIEFASLDIILFLVGMMIVIGFLEERRFFEVVVETVVRRAGSGAKRLTATLMALSALSAALVDEVTSILFMTTLTLHITRRYSVNPVPFLIMVVFATNIGSSATVVGNPIGVLIALRGGLTFVDFLRWATPISVITLGLTVALCWWYFRDEIETLGTGLNTNHDVVEVEKVPRRDLIFSGSLFVATILGLILHGRLEAVLSLERNTLLLGVALAAAGLALFLEGERAPRLVERRVDWWTLSFFMFLFASVGTLRYVGVTQILAKGILGWTGGGSIALLVTITWASGFLSAVMDNVLAVATFVPILGDLEQAGINVRPLWWGLLFGGTLLGNLTVIGSTANIIAVGLLERRERKHVSFLEWLGPGVIVAVPTLILATLLIALQLPWLA